MTPSWKITLENEERIFLETSESHTAFERTQLEGKVCCFHRMYCRFANVYYFKIAAVLEHEVS